MRHLIKIPFKRITGGVLLLSFIAFAEEKSCNFSLDLNENIEHLLDWCERHHIPEAECEDLMDSASTLSASDFRTKLYNFHTNPPPIPKDETLNSLTKQDWTQIPSKPMVAFQKLTELSTISSGGFAKVIHFEKQAGTFFNTLKSAEIKSAFQIIEQMKTSATRAEFENFLKKKHSEILEGTSGNKYCNGTHVVSVRLSQGSRMCFQYIQEDSTSIKILCIGQGRHCYEH